MTYCVIYTWYSNVPNCRGGSITRGGGKLKRNLKKGGLGERYSSCKFCTQNPALTFPNCGLRHCKINTMKKCHQKQFSRQVLGFLLDPSNKQIGFLSVLQNIVITCRVSIHCKRENTGNKAVEMTHKNRLLNMILQSIIGTNFNLNIWKVTESDIQLPHHNNVSDPKNVDQYSKKVPVSHKIAYLISLLYFFV